MLFVAVKSLRKYFPDIGDKQAFVASQSFSQLNEDLNNLFDVMRHLCKGEFFEANYVILLQCWIGVYYPDSRKLQRLTRLKLSLKEN